MSKRPFIFSLFLSALVAGTADSAPPSATWILKAPPLAEAEGEVIRVSSTDQLFEAVRKIPPGGTISLADGLYRLPRYLEISTDDVTLRSESGDRHRVVLDGSGSRHGELLGITGCEGVTIADLTVQNVKWNGIKINSDRGAQRISIYNCVLHNIWQRGVKAPAIPEGKPDSLAPRDCRIQYCLFYNDRPKITSESTITQSRNEAHPEFPTTPTKVVGQPVWTPAQIDQIITWVAQRKATVDSEREEGSQVGVQTPEVITAMRAVHEGFKGQRGYIAQFGDSITFSMAFWSAMSWDDVGKFLTHDDGLPKAPEKLRWRDYIKGARDKGQKFANYSGWKVGNLLKSVDAVLAEKKPEAAIIMIGTNDINGGAVPENYRANLDQVITKCLEAHCVPILNTIPPRRGKAELVDEINGIIREIATARKIPLADYHAEILRLRPENTWDGTIISDDGVHPSGGKSNLYDVENLKSCGYALRNWVNFLALRQIYFRVFEAQD